MPDSTTFARVTAVAVVAAALLAACASEPKGPSTPTSAPAAPAPSATGPAAPTTPAPATAELSPAQAKAQAQKLALEAVDQLQNGDEASARATLAGALGLDAANELARKMQDQVNADAQRELGATFFRYTVQRDESLSKLAQQYMGDRFRFYILAKYNDIANPSRLATGQVIKIPGKAPPPGAAAARAPGAAEVPDAAAKPAPVDAEATVRADLAELLQKGRAQQRNGDLEGAYGTFGDAVLRFPGNRDAVMQRDGAKAALVRNYDREATQAFQRQNLDLAIVKWDRILELDPGNQKAKLERERALDLKKRMSEKFGKTN